MFMGESDRAIENFLKAINLPPKDDFWLWYHVPLGRLYINQKKDVKKGLPYLRKGLEIGSQYLPSVYLHLGRSYLDIGDYERAEKYIRKGLELEVGNCWGIWGYSNVMQVQGKLQQAFQFTDSICQKIECEQTCYKWLFEESLLLNEFEEAEQYFYKWQNAQASFGSSLNEYEIGYIYYQLGKTDEAEKIFTEQIQKLQSSLDEENRWPYLNLSRIYAFRGDKIEALKYLSEYAKRGFTHGWHDFILIDPFFESLRDDPEFKAIVKQAQDEKAALRAKVREMEERGESDL